MIHNAYLLGNPNVGKTTLFNYLTSSSAKVSNIPGATVTERRSSVRVGGETYSFYDLPGTYSLTPLSPDEEAASIAIERVREDDEAMVLIVVDASAPERSLYLVLQVIERKLPCAIVLTMNDTASAREGAPGLECLSEAFNIPVVRAYATEGKGLEEVVEAVENASVSPFVLRYPDAVEDEVTAKGMKRSQAIDEILRPGNPLASAVVSTRYHAIDEILSRSPQEIRKERMQASRRIDNVLTRPLAGSLVFLAVMFVVFQVLFTGVTPVTDLIEAGIASLSSLFATMIPAGIFQDLVVEGIVAGVGNVLVFVPQIFFLFFLIATLEDSGYLARAAFLADRLFKRAGITGRAFVPLLSGFACAVPAIMGTRVLERRRDRLLAIFAIPFVSCSARLPIYILVTGTVFLSMPPLWGVFSWSGIVIVLMYALSVFATFAALFVLSRTALRGESSPFLLELPPYRMPSLMTGLRHAGEQTMSFLKSAGTIILALSILMWGALTFPRVEPESSDVSETSQLEQSFAGQLGKSIEPVLEPMGLDWRVGVGVVGAFAAREVFVSTLAIIFEKAGIEDPDDPSLQGKLKNAEKENGAKLFTPLSGIALMVFFVLACQCMSTLAVAKREMQSWMMPVGMFVSMTLIATFAAIAVYQIGKVLGFA